MVILHLVAPGEFGGLERVVQLLALGQRAVGHEVHVAAVVVRRGPERSLLRSLSEAGVHTHPLVVATRAYLKERAAIAALCRELHPDIVHTHGYRPDVVDAGVARRLGIPVVTTLHGFTSGGWKNWCYEWLQYRVFRRFDAIVAVSRPLAERLRRAGVPHSRIHAVPNAWGGGPAPLERAAARAALGLPGDRFIVGWVGRLSREKGADVLVDALCHLRNLPLIASVIGTGVERRALKARANALGLNGRVRWHDSAPQASRLFTAFDAFVLSSRAEGTPIVLFEAMAAGVPIVATRVGGVPDVVSPTEATLVPVEDPGALAAAIRRVHEMPAAAAQRAAAARGRLERDFSVAPWLERYEAIYRGVSRGAPVST